MHDAAGKLVGRACRLTGEHWASATGGFSERWFDFVAVGRRAISEVPEYPATILALQIEWEGGVALRVNLAEIGEGDWVEAGPVGRLIVLA